MSLPRTGPVLAGLLGGPALLLLAALAAGPSLGELSRAWLVSALFWAAFPLGALPVLCTHALTGGGWGEDVTPTLRAAAATLPLVALFFLPLPILAMHDLFSWTAPAETLPEVVRRKTSYLNAPFFAARNALYLGVWLLLAWRLGAWRPGGAPTRGVGAGGAIAWILTVTFFGFDWVMSLEPKWYSDIFGMVFGAALVAPAMALAIVVAAARPEHDERRTARLQDFANLWLAVLIGWLFLHFAQYLIIWSGNLPHEIEWFVHRSTGGWRVVSWALVLLMFALPFPVLLSRRLKRNRRALAIAAAIVIAGHLTNCVWLVLPSFHHDGFALPLVTPAVWLWLGGLWTVLFLSRCRAIMERRGKDAGGATAVKA